MQEVAYGHAGFLGAATWNVLPLAWLEHHLLTPVMARYATAKPVDIRYQVNGRWMDVTAAAKARDWKRVSVSYDNGLVIVANGSDTPFQAGSHLLPSSGWWARGAGVTAWTAFQDGVVADYAETADSVFANARSAADWNISGVHPIRPQVAAFAQIGLRAIRFTYAWRIDDTLPQDYLCFVHFGKPAAAGSPEDILFQQDHALPMPTSQWRPGTNVMDGPYTLRLPDNLPDGDYEWKIGLYAPGAGRVSLEGMDDGQGRIRLGLLRVQNGGQTLTFEPERRGGEAQQRLYAQHLNLAGKIVGFGPVRTNGSVLIRREGNEWALRTFPRERYFTLELRANRFGRPVRVRCVGGKTTQITPEARGDYWRLPLNDAQEYRWTAHRAIPSN